MNMKFIKFNHAGPGYSCYKALVLAVIAIFICFINITEAVSKTSEIEIINLENSELVISFKNLGQSVDKFLNSKFMTNFQSTPIYARFEQTSLNEKISQFKKSFLNGIGAGFKYQKFIEFISVNADLYFINTDMDMPLWLLSANCNVSKLDYFLKLKKSIIAEQVKGDTQIYTFAPDDSTNFICFCVINNRTFVSNNFDILKNLVLQKTRIIEKTCASQIKISFNLESFQARMTNLFKGLKYILIDINYDEKNPELIKIAVSECAECTVLQPELDRLFAGFETNASGTDSNIFSFAAYDFNNTGFFAETLTGPVNLDEKSDLYAALNEIKNQAKNGIYLFLNDKTQGSVKNCGIYTAAFKTNEKLGNDAINKLKKYFPDYSVRYLNENLIISNDSIDDKAVTEKLAACEKIKNIDNKNKLSYFYTLKPAKAIDIFQNILHEMITIKDWKSSEAFEFTGDLEKSLEALAAIDEIKVFSISGIKNLNSLISIKFN